MPKKTTSNVLIDDYPLLLLPHLAAALNGNKGRGGNRNGDRKAVFLQQVHYWLTKAENPHEKWGRFKDGRWWIFNSIGQWQRDNFPMWSEDTVNRIINELVEDGVLLRDQEGSGRPTKSWFSIDYVRLQALVGNGCTVLPISAGMDAQCPEPAAQRPQLEGTRDYPETTYTDNSAATAADLADAASSGKSKKSKPSKPTSRDRGHVPAIKLGLAVIHHCGAHVITDAMEGKLTTPVPVIDHGKPTEISPAELYESDEKFQQWVETTATDLKRRFGGHVSRWDLVAALTNGGGDHNITISLQTYITWRETHAAPQVYSDRLSVVSEDTIAGSSSRGNWWEQIETPEGE